MCHVNMDRRTYIGAAGVATATLLAGCGGDGGGGDTGNDNDDGDGGGNTTPAGGVAATYVIESSSVDEPVKEVPVGATVRWESQDSGVVAHTISSDQFTDNAAEWELSETAVEGGSFTHTFEAVGVYQWYSENAGESVLCGALVVGDAELTGTLPCE